MHFNFTEVTPLVYFYEFSPVFGVFVISFNLFHVCLGSSLAAAVQGGNHRDRPQIRSESGAGRAHIYILYRLPEPRGYPYEEKAYVYEVFKQICASF